MAADDSVNKPPEPSAFPAAKLGAFLRAMADPEGTGRLDAAQEDRISNIERGLAGARRPAEE